jgi:hypothetical protein
MITGSPKARVLPEPVWALPQTSRPARASGMVRVWIGNGDVMPDAARASARSGATPSAPKDFVVMMGS